MTARVLFILALLAAMFFGFYPDQVSKAQGTKPSIGATAANSMAITGIIIKEPDGYFIQGQRPAEVFTILNPVPDQLDKFVKSGQPAKIDVRIVQGDNVEIEKINGKTYYQKKEK